MQFTDGSRIDLTLIPIDRIADIEEDSLSVLLDKDVIFILFPQPSETSYLPKPPTRKAYDDCCNEFLWLVPYVVKGLARGDILYAKPAHDHADLGFWGQDEFQTQSREDRETFPRNPGI